MALHPSGQFQLQKDCEYLGGLYAALADQYVDLDGCRTELFLDQRPHGIGAGRFACKNGDGWHDRFTERVPQHRA